MDKLTTREKGLVLIELGTFVVTGLILRETKFNSIRNRFSDLLNTKSRYNKITAPELLLLINILEEIKKDLVEYKTIFSHRKKKLLQEINFALSSWKELYENIKEAPKNSKIGFNQ